MKNYVITARKKSKSVDRLLYLAKEREGVQCFWTSNLVDNVVDFYNPTEAMDYMSKQQSIQLTLLDNIDPRSLMVQKLEYSLVPVEWIIQNQNGIINTGISYTGKEIESWCLNNINDEDAAYIFDIYLNSENSDTFSVSLTAYYFVVKKVCGNDIKIILYRDRERSYNNRK